jgi:hypothetical protein
MRVGLIATPKFEFGHAFSSQSLDGYSQCRRFGVMLRRRSAGRDILVGLLLAVQPTAHAHLQANSHGDPDPETGQFGIHDCMGRVRTWDFEAVIGVGGLSAKPRSLAGKVNWIGIGRRRGDRPSAGQSSPSNISSASTPTSRTCRTSRTGASARRENRSECASSHERPQLRRTERGRQDKVIQLRL